MGKLSSDVADVQTALTNTAVGTQDEQKRVSALESAFGRFRFNGDARVRGENFNQNGECCKSFEPGGWGNRTLPQPYAV